MTEVTPVEAVPFDDMDKKAMWEHLGHHGDGAAANLINRTYGGKSKVTKKTLIDWHKRLHGGDVKAPVGVVRHIHTALVPVAEDVAAEKARREEAIRNGDAYIGSKPLTSAERAALRTLVDNDFATLRSEMRQFADDTLQERLRQVTADWADKRAQAPKYVSQLTTMVSRSVAAIREVADKALADGIQINTTNLLYHLNRSEFTFDVTGEREAKQKIKQEVDQDLNRALLTLERQRLTVHRRILLASVPEGAQSLVNQLPQASALMLEAAQVREAQKAIGDKVDVGRE